jgi:NitT/TauT family transport system ATP-binding protein
VTGWSGNEVGAGSDVSRNRRQQRPAKLIVDSASKVYQTRTGAVPALEDFHMVAHEGELVCVIGPSGCGKSTLLWSMAGLHALSRGRILLDEKPVVEPDPQIGMVFQDANLLPWRTLQRNIELPFEFKRLKPRDYRQRIDALLARVGLEGFRDKYPRELSGGMQQRASIVRSLSFDPTVLLMDEPFGALDAFTRDEMNLLIQEIWMETGKTIVFVTHNIAEAIFLADRIMVMTPRPGRLSRIYHIDFPRPRPIALTTTTEFVALVAEIKASIDHGTVGAARGQWEPTP